MSATIVDLERAQREAAYHKKRLNFHKRQLRAAKELEARYAAELRRLGIGFKSEGGEHPWLNLKKSST